MRGKRLLWGVKLVKGKDGLFFCIQLEFCILGQIKVDRGLGVIFGFKSLIKYLVYIFFFQVIFGIQDYFYFEIFLE